MRPIVKLSDGPIGLLLIMENVLTRSALRINFLPLRKTTVTVCFPTNVFIFPNYYIYKVNQKKSINYERLTLYVYWMLPSFNLSFLCFMTPYITSLSLSKAFLAKTHDRNPASSPFRLYGITLFSSTLSSSF